MQIMTVMITTPIIDSMPDGTGWREHLMRALVSFHYNYYHRFTYKDKSAWVISIDELLCLPRETIGYQLGDFLRQNGFEFIPKFENHDLFHVLLEYGLTVGDEVRMQCCLAGSGRRTFSTWITIIIGCLFYPEHWRSFYVAYRRGAKLCNFSYWDFEPMLTMPVSELRVHIHGRNTQVETVVFSASH